MFVVLVVAARGYTAYGEYQNMITDSVPSLPELRNIDTYDQNAQTVTEIVRQFGGIKQNSWSNQQDISSVLSRVDDLRSNVTNHEERTRLFSLFPDLLDAAVYIGQAEKVFGGLQTRMQTQKGRVKMLKDNMAQEFKLGTGSFEDVKHIVEAMTLLAQRFNSATLAQEATGRTIAQIKESAAFVKQTHAGLEGSLDQFKQAEKDTTEGLQRLTKTSEEVLNIFLSWMHHQRTFKLTELTKKHNDNIYRLEDMKTRCLKAMEESSKIGEVWLKLAPMVKNRLSRIKVEKAVKAKPDIELFLQDAATDSVPETTTADIPVAVPPQV